MIPKIESYTLSKPLPLPMKVDFLNSSIPRPPIRTHKIPLPRIDADVFHLVQTKCLDDVYDYYAFKETLNTQEWNQRFFYCQRKFSRHSPTALLYFLEMFRLVFCIHPTHPRFHTMMLNYEHQLAPIQQNIKDILTSYRCSGKCCHP